MPLTADTLETAPGACRFDYRVPVPILAGASQLCRLFDVSRATLDKWRAQGKFPMPVYRQGQKHRWRVAEIEAWFLAGCPLTEEWERLKSA